MLKDKLKTLPNEFGVYIYKNEFDEIIYIGKAKNLKKRVSQYFLKNQKSIKTQTLVKRIKDLDFIVVNNEVEALLLENKLIKKHNPKYNIKLKDDKTYAYLKLTDEKFPKLIMTRIIRKNNNKNEIYFGPYADNTQRFNLLNLCVELFQILTNKTYSNKTQIYFDIGLAPAKSKNEINQIEYKKKVEMTKDFLKGKNINQILKKLYKQMEKESVELNFEMAIKIKEKIISIEYLTNQNSQIVDLIKNNIQDIIVYKKMKNEKIKFLILKIKNGTILKKEIYVI
jgi:excinuclease ABC subunit C